MTFAQALARIEELNQMLAVKDDGSKFYAEKWLERKELILEHANFIVQLKNLSANMRDSFTVRYDENDESFVASKVDHLSLGEAGAALDLLMEKSK